VGAAMLASGGDPGGVAESRCDGSQEQRSRGRSSVLGGGYSVVGGIQTRPLPEVVRLLCAMRAFFLGRVYAGAAARGFQGACTVDRDLWCSVVSLGFEVGVDEAGSTPLHT